MITDITFIKRNNKYFDKSQGFIQGINLDTYDGSVTPYSFSNLTTLKECHELTGDRSKDSDSTHMVLSMGIPVFTDIHYVKIGKIIIPDKATGRKVYCEEFLYPLAPNTNSFLCYAVRVTRLNNYNRIFSVNFNIIQNCRYIRQFIMTNDKSRLHDKNFIMNEYDNEQTLVSFLSEYFNLYQGDDFTEDTSTNSLADNSIYPIIYSSHTFTDFVNSVTEGTYDFYANGLNTKDSINNDLVDYFNFLKSTEYRYDKLVSIKRMLPKKFVSDFQFPIFDASEIYVNDAEFIELFDCSLNYMASEFDIEYFMEQDQLVCHYYVDKYLESLNLQTSVDIEIIRTTCFEIIDIFIYKLDIVTVNHNLRFIKNHAEEIYFYLTDLDTNKVYLIYYDICRLNLKCSNLLH